MKQKIYLVLFLLVISFSFANAQIVELTFTGESGTSYVPLTSVIIENITQGGDTVLNYPDTVITLGTVGIGEGKGVNSFSVQQNYPNPFDVQTNIDIFLPEAGNVDIAVHNVIGKELISYNKSLSQGSHSFSFTPGNGEVYFLTARHKTGVKSIRMVAVSSNNKKRCALDYKGSGSNIVTHKSTKGFQFVVGDQLKLIGNSLAGSDTIVDAPTTDFTYVFQYNSSAACKGIASFVYGGQTYTTVGIGSQCWMQENLNIGLQINGLYNQADNSIIEKYCYDNNAVTCDFLGALYQWDEMMNYGSSASVNQGICPWGWHIPTDDEWTILIDYLGGSTMAGGKMKDTTLTHWLYPNLGATNSSGFTALPGGLHDKSMQYFNTVGENAIFMSSTEKASNTSWTLWMQYNTAHTARLDNLKVDAFSVRCMKDTCSPLPTIAYGGPDLMNILDDSTILMANTPVFGLGQWSLFSGAGGSFVDTTDPGTVFYGIQDSVYVLVWTISNSCGSTSDTVVIGFGQAFYCGVAFTDHRDSTNYKTVQIGNQCWMAENLAYLPDITSGYIISETAPCYYVYGYDGSSISDAKATINYSFYGVLYNWTAAMNGDASSDSVPSGVQGICPDGWHLPSDSEWMILEGNADSLYKVGDPEWLNTGYRGSNVGRNLKSVNHWTYDPANVGVDLYGFGALPGGQLSPFQPGWIQKGYGGFYRTSTLNGFAPSIRSMYNSSIQIRRSSGYYKEDGASVRCVRD